jgi:hypothetical protein
MRIWTLARLERKEGMRRPILARRRVKLAGLLIMLALPLVGLLLFAIASTGAGPIIGQTGMTQGGLGNAQSLKQQGANGSVSTQPPHGYASVVVAAARSQIGAHYAAVGDTPQTGFSCVGLVHWAYARAGLMVPESAPAIATAYAHVTGATPAGAHLLPGDILLFVNTAWAGYSHAAIYVGNGMMVSADSPQTGVRLEPLDASYWIAHWAGAARVPDLIQDVSRTGGPHGTPSVRPMEQLAVAAASFAANRAPQVPEARFATEPFQA